MIFFLQKITIVLYKFFLSLLNLYTEIAEVLCKLAIFVAPNFARIQV